MTATLKPKNQRLILALLALAAVVGAGLLAVVALRQQADFFYTPASAAAARLAPGTSARVGGMVVRGSIRRAADGVTIDFMLTDGQAQLPVRYAGIVPNLFAEGAGAVADGRFAAGGVFVADRILAKHDERYMPPELGDIPAGAGTGASLDDR